MDKGGEMKETRKPGYYWTRINSEWSVSSYAFGGWDGWAFDIPKSDQFFDEIDETPITRAAVPSECDTIGITYYQIACETIRDQEKRIAELEAELNAVYKKLNEESKRLAMTTKDTTPTLSDADRKAAHLYAWDNHPSITIAYETAKESFEAGILHARANDDPGPEWVSSNILEGAAKRIKELEAEVARNTTIVKYDPVLTEAMRQQAQDRELFEQWKAIQSPSSAPVKNPFSDHINDEKKLVSPSKDTPDLTDKILDELEIIDGCTEDIENGHFGRATNVILNSTDKIRDLMAGQSSPVSVDINQEILEALQLLYTYTPDFPKNKTEFDNGFVKAIYQAKIAIERAKAALSKASPPKQSGE